MSNGETTSNGDTMSNGDSCSGENLDALTAEELKTKANLYFSKKNYEQAVILYTKAIEKDPNNAIYYGNRSFAHLRTECFGYAFDDASKAIELDKNYIKAYYRRAASLMANGKWKLALKDFETVVKFSPNDPDARRNYSECKKIYNQISFAKAIAVETKKKSVADSLNLDLMSIDDYDGPKMVNDEVTREFILEMIEYFRQEKLLHRKYAFQIILKVRDIFRNAPSLVDITVPKDTKFTVCGDVHGQYYDLLNIFKLNGFPSEENPYLFNGDVVDRGSFSVECILVMFAFKVLYPNHFFLARGNHESDNMNQIFGFEGEVRNKYSPQMFELFSEVFESLPLAHCINNKVFVMHGGLFGRDDVTLDDIRAIDRFRQPPDEGLMCDLLWSDPMAQLGRATSKRGVGVQFGPGKCCCCSFDHHIR